MFWVVKYWKFSSRDQGYDSTVALILHKNKNLQANVKYINFLTGLSTISISSNLGQDPLECSAGINWNCGTYELGPIHFSLTATLFQFDFSGKGKARTHLQGYHVKVIAEFTTRFTICWYQWELLCRVFLESG